MVEFVKELLKNKHFRLGLPFMLLVVLSSFGLKEFASLRYDFRKSQPLTTVDAEIIKRMKPKGSVTLESEYEKIKNLDIDNWTNKRGPRLFEETQSDE